MVKDLVRGSENLWNKTCLNCRMKPCNLQKQILYINTGSVIAHIKQGLRLALELSSLEASTNFL